MTALGNPILHLPGTRRREPGSWNLLNRVGRRAFRRALTESGPNLMFARLMTSRHLQDLQLLSLLGLVAITLCILIPIGEAVFPASGGASVPATTTSDSNLPGTATPAQNVEQPATDNGWDIPKLALGVVAAAGAVLSWAYQAGSRRMGIVDLFACEIGVICRVCLVVNLAEMSIARLDTLHEAVLGSPTTVSHLRITPLRLSSPVRSTTPLYTIRTSLIWRRSMWTPSTT